MPFIPTPDCLQVEMIFNWDNQIVENVFHYDMGGGFNAADADMVAAAIKTAWDTTLKAQTAATCSLTKFRMTDVTTQTGFATEYATGLPIAGTKVSASMPNSVSVTIKKATAKRGRSYRGRMFFIGLTEDNVTNNIINSGLTTTFGNFFAAIDSIAISAGGPAILSVRSLYNGNAPRSEGILTPVTSFITDLVVDSQRRRLPGRGS